MKLLTVLARIGLVLATALVLSGCQQTHADDPTGAVEVPKLVGKQYRPVQELLAARGLRWTFFESKVIWSKAPAANVWSTADDDFVTDQLPAAGTKVEAGSVIQLRTSCTMEPLPPGSACID